MWGFQTSQGIPSVCFHSITFIVLSPCLAEISDLVNLNEYIDIFPPTYFVKIYFDTLVSNNLGPSTVPLTLIKFNYRKYLNKDLIRWLKYPLRIAA
jgi:hypothetical protein